jgi:hypothetical protein
MAGRSLTRHRNCKIQTKRLPRLQQIKERFKKRLFVMASTAWPDLCDGQHCGAVLVRVF